MIQLLVVQVEAVTKLLEERGLAYWLSPLHITVDKRPPFTSIHLYNRVNGKEVQALLDTLP